MSKLGIFGGTFDPFHRGHLEPIVAVRDAMQWDGVIYVPAFAQPFKQGRGHASGYHRFAMAVLATQEFPWISVSPLELERGGVSYTVDTLEVLRREHAGATIDWIIGDDNLASLHEWRSIDRIFELANFVVLTRNAAAAAAEADGEMASCCAPASRPRNGAIVYAENDLVPASSTEIRRLAAAGEPIAELVGSRVSRYIQQNVLYGKGPS